MAEITNPHDRFFKEVLAQPETAADLLANYLPPETVALLDLSSLEVVKDSFLDEELQQHFSDLLYSARLKDGQPVFAYLLFEHKSHPAREVALQLLRYQVRIWERLPRTADGLLPPVIQIVLYHGEARWTAATQFNQLVAGGNEAALQRFIPQCEYWLIDLAAYVPGNAERRNHPARLSGAAKIYFQRKPAQAFAGYFCFVLLGRMMERDALEYLRTILIYLSKANRQLTRKEVTMALEQTLPQYTGEIIAPFALEWMEEERQKGQQEGRQEGIANFMMRSLRKQFGKAADSLEPEIRTLTVEQLEKLQDKSFELASAEELAALLSQLRGQ